MTMTPPSGEMIVQKIGNGTVIDHVTAGRGLLCLRILNIPSTTQFVLASNVSSKRMRRKDIIKIEDKFLSKKEFDRLALVAPRATINIIRDGKVAEKRVVELPKTIRGVISCNNPACVAFPRNERFLEPRFTVETDDPLLIKCDFCDHELSRKDVDELL